MSVVCSLPLKFTAQPGRKTSRDNELQCPEHSDGHNKAQSGRRQEDLCSGGGTEQAVIRRVKRTRFPGRSRGILRQRQCEKNRHESYFLTFILHKRLEIFHLNLVFKHFFPYRPTWLCFKSLHSHELHNSIIGLPCSSRNHVNHPNS